MRCLFVRASIGTRLYTDVASARRRLQGVNSGLLLLDMAQYLRSATLMISQPSRDHKLGAILACSPALLCLVTHTRFSAVVISLNGAKYCSGNLHSLFHKITTHVNLCETDVAFACSIHMVFDFSPFPRTVLNFLFSDVFSSAEPEDNGQPR